MTTPKWNFSIYLLAILPPLFWAGNFVLGKWAVTTIPPVQLSFFRWLIALFILSGITYKTLKDHYKTIIKNIKKIFIFSLLGIVGFNIFIYIALQKTTAINGALINSTMPIVTLLLSIFIIKESFQFKQYIGITASFFGLLVLFSSGDLSVFLKLNFNQGDIFILLGVACWSLYTILVKKWVIELPFFVFLFSIVFIGCLLHIPLLFIEASYTGWANFSYPTLTAIIYLAIFPSILAYFFWGKVVTSIGPAKASLFMYLTPIFSTIFALIFLKEKIHVHHLVGFIFVVIGIVLVNKVHKKNGTIEIS